MPGEWYYSKNNAKVIGPLSTGELRKLAALGELTPNDLVGEDRKEGLVKAGSVKGLFARPWA